MGRVGIYVHNIVAHTVIEEWNEKYVSMINNVRTKEKP